jgi:hypothetical protein
MFLGEIAPLQFVELGGEQNLRVGLMLEETPIPSTQVLGYARTLNLKQLSQYNNLEAIIVGKLGSLKESGRFDDFQAKPSWLLGSDLFSGC